MTGHFLYENDWGEKKKRLNELESQGEKKIKAKFLAVVRFLPTKGIQEPEPVWPSGKALGW